MRTRHTLRDLDAINQSAKGGIDRVIGDGIIEVRDELGCDQFGARVGDRQIEDAQLIDVDLRPCIGDARNDVFPDRLRYAVALRQREGDRCA